MGQRTAIILQHVRIENGNRDINTSVFYCQWGTGRIMPTQLLSICNGTILVSAYSEDFAKEVKPSNCIDITEEYTEDLNGLDFDKPEEVGRIIEGGNKWNNNGGIFIRITREGCFTTAKIEYAYMLGYEENGDYKRFCTDAEWMAKAGPEDRDSEFMDYYKRALKYFNAEEKCK